MAKTFRLSVSLSVEEGCMVYAALRDYAVLHPALASDCEALTGTLVGLLTTGPGLVAVKRLTGTTRQVSKRLTYAALIQ